MDGRKLVVCVSDRQLGSLRSIGEPLGIEVLPVEHFDTATEELLIHERPLCAVFDGSDPRGADFCARVRRCSALFDLQVIAIVDEPWSSAPKGAFALGADEYVPGFALERLTETLVALREESSPVGPLHSGRIVLADPDREHRVTLGRQLRRMGLEVQFALDASIATDPSLRLIVAHVALPPEGAIRCLRTFRASNGADVPWVVFGRKDDLGAMQRQIDGESNLAFLDIDADASQIVFVVNGLLAKDLQSKRKTVRYPYETPARWTTSRGADDRWGYTYNINTGGIYVRTLTPPPPGTLLTLELRPPFGRGRVVVDGLVAWRQAYTRSGQPPGFGVKYVEQPEVADAAALEAGYRRLCRQQEDGGLESPLPDVPVNCDRRHETGTAGSEAVDEK